MKRQWNLYNMNTLGQIPDYQGVLIFQLDQQLWWPNGRT